MAKNGNETHGQAEYFMMTEMHKRETHVHIINLKKLQLHVCLKSEMCMHVSHETLHEKVPGTPLPQRLTWGQRVSFLPKTESTHLPHFMLQLVRKLATVKLPSKILLFTPKCNHMNAFEKKSTENVHSKLFTIPITAN